MFPCTITKEEICFNNDHNSLMAIRGDIGAKGNVLFITVLRGRDTNTLKDDRNSLFTPKETLKTFCASRE